MEVRDKKIKQLAKTKTAKEISQILDINITCVYVSLKKTNTKAARAKIGRPVGSKTLHTSQRKEKYQLVKPEYKKRVFDM